MVRLLSAVISVASLGLLAMTATPVMGQGCGVGQVNVTVNVYADNWPTETTWQISNGYYSSLLSLVSVASTNSWQGCLYEGDHFVIQLVDTLDPAAKYGGNKLTYRAEGDGFTGTTNGFAVFVDGTYTLSEQFGPVPPETNTWSAMTKGYTITNSTAVIWYSDDPSYCYYPAEYADYPEYICFIQTDSFYQEEIDSYYSPLPMDPTPVSSDIAGYKKCRKLEMTLTNTGGNPFAWDLIAVDPASSDPNEMDTGSLLSKTSGTQANLTYKDDCFFTSMKHNFVKPDSERQAYLYLYSGFSGSVSFKIDGVQVPGTTSVSGPTYLLLTLDIDSDVAEVSESPCNQTIRIDVESDAYVKEFSGVLISEDFTSYYVFFTADGWVKNSTSMSYVMCLTDDLLSSQGMYLQVIDSFADGISSGKIAIYSNTMKVFQTTSTDFGPFWFLGFGLTSEFGFDNSSLIEYSPTPTCTSNEKLLTVLFSPDEYPEETTIKIQGLDSVSSYYEEFSPESSFGEYFTSAFKTLDYYFLYPVKMCVAPGSYSIVFEDSFGDGFCCQFGNGFAEIVYNQQTLGFVDANFFYSKSGSLVIPNNGLATYSDVPKRTLTISIQPDEYPSDVSWQIFDSTSAVVESSSLSSYDYGLQESTVQLGAGKYKFVISDYHEDGICCSSGSGYFDLSIKFDDGSSYQFYHDPGTYGAMRTVKFRIDSSGNASIDDGSCESTESKWTIRIWPDQFPQETSWAMLSSAGSVLSSGQLTSTDYPYYEDQGCVSNTANYFFTMYDDGEDGICCSFGVGKYLLEVGTGAPSAAKNMTNPSKGDFGVSETLSFKIAKNGDVTQTKQVNGISFTVTINADDYPQEVSWILYSVNTTSKGTVYTSLVSGTSSLDTAYALKVGTAYRFQIIDSYSDGLCCDYGQGNYSIFVNESLFYFSNGTYGEYQNVDFLIEKDNYTVTGVVTALQCASNEARLILNLTYDDYPRETDWYLYRRNKSALTLISSGNGAGQTETLKSWCLITGDYVFSITDSKDDGICCTFGKGSYQLSTNDKNVYRGNGTFETRENITITVNGITKVINGSIIEVKTKSSLGLDVSFFVAIMIMVAMLSGYFV